MKAKALAWGGVRTERYEEMKSFVRDRLGLELDHENGQMAAFELPNGDTFEVFGPEYKDNEHFTTGPVIGFAVDDVESARRELENAGVELIGPIQEGGGFRWAHFRGPDGNVYEVTES